jgi:hypothetical protein
MDIDVTGDITSASGDDIADLKAATLGSLVHSVNVGSGQAVDVYQNETDPTDKRTEIRSIMSNDINNGVWEYKGSVLPDIGDTDAAYSIDV